MVISIHPASLTPLSDIALALDLQQAGAGQELRSRDGERLIVKDGPTGRNRCGGRDLHRSQAVRIISTALTAQLIFAGMDRKDAEPATMTLVHLVRPLPSGSAPTVPLKVRHVIALKAHAEGAALHSPSAKAYCDALQAAPDSKAGAKPQTGARLDIPRPINHNRIIELIEPADFESGLTVTIERLVVAPWRAVDKDAKGGGCQGQACCLPAAEVRCIVGTLGDHERAVE